MGVVVAAIASSVLAGAATGAVIATATRGNGFRARPSVRHHTRVVKRGGGCIAVGSLAVALAGVLVVSQERTALALTCLATSALIALASWLLLVEEDEDYPGETPDEPEWWPAFEREFDAWTRRSRVPAGRRG